MCQSVTANNWTQVKFFADGFSKLRSLVNRSATPIKFPALEHTQVVSEFGLKILENPPNLFSFEFLFFHFFIKTGRAS